MPTMTQRDRKKALGDVMDTLSELFMDDVDDQGKKMAANMLIMYGGKTAVTSEGIVIASVGAASGILLWAATEGYITFTDKALASEEEIAKREEDKPPTKAQVADAGIRGPRPPGAYL